MGLLKSSFCKIFWEMEDTSCALIIPILVSRVEVGIYNDAGETHMNLNPPLAVGIKSVFVSFVGPYVSKPSSENIFR